jgi:hypothetical protein
MEVFRDRVAIGERPVPAMECRVKAGDLRNPWPKRQERPDRRQIVRLMQRRERNVLLEASEHVLVDQNRPVIVGPAMDHAMADGHKFHFLRLPQPVRRHSDRGGYIGDFFRAILLVDQRRAFACLRPHARPRSNSVNLPFEQAAERVGT